MSRAPVFFCLEKYNYMDYYTYLCYPHTKMPDPNRPIGKLARITNVLPPPKQLAVSEHTIKVTLLLSAASVQFFKRQAAQYGTKYQRMIRKLVDQYAAQHSAEGDGVRR